MIVSDGLYSYNGEKSFLVDCSVGLIICEGQQLHAYAIIWLTIRLKPSQKSRGGGGSSPPYSYAYEGVAIGDRG